MFEPTSRYYVLETAQLTEPNGRVISYKRRRFLPRGDTLPLLAELAVDPDERLDTISARTIGDPEQFWRLCDANDAMNPFDLTAEALRTIRVPMPQVEERR